jgi:hypothetical protein
MNRICWALENKFNDVKYIVNSSTNFDPSIKKSGYTYAKSKYDEIKEIYDEYKNDVRQYMITSRDLKSNEKKEKRSIFINKYRQKAYKKCGNQYVLCNILIDMCYKGNFSKQFVWDICGDTIIENLLNKNGNKINYPVLTEKEPEFYWNGLGYKMIEKEIGEGDDEFTC